MLARADEDAWLKVVQKVTAPAYSKMDWRGTVTNSRVNSQLKDVINFDRMDLVKKSPAMSLEDILWRIHNKVKTQEEEEQEKEDCWPGDLVTQLLTSFDLSERSPNYQAAHAELAKRGAPELLRVPIIEKLRLTDKDSLVTCVGSILVGKSNNSFFTVASVRYAFVETTLTTDGVCDWRETEPDNDLSVSAIHSIRR